MWRTKSNLVVGLTTFDTEWLRVSIPALGKLREKIFLVIYNDNPCVRVARRQIRRLGYRGPLHIINTTDNVGVMFARCAIANAVRNLKLKHEWIVFVDDDDILINGIVPNVSNDIFAIVQNSMTVRNRVATLLKIMESNDCTPDDENIILNRPNMCFGGLLIRLSEFLRMTDILKSVRSEIKSLDDDADYRPPVDAIMWAMLQKSAYKSNGCAAPIYMNSVNYIKNALDINTYKYGRAPIVGRGVQSRVSRIISRYMAVFDAAIDDVTTKPDDK